MSGLSLSLCHMLYLCICVFVFVYLCMRHLEISVQISLGQELSENVWFVWSKTSQSGKVEVMTHTAGRPADFHLQIRPIRRMGGVKTTILILKIYILIQISPNTSKILVFLLLMFLIRFCHLFYSCHHGVRFPFANHAWSVKVVTLLKQMYFNL